MNTFPLRDVVFNTLRQAILRGEFKPGERLMEIQLANKLGVSRTPIREAIRKLELKSLVIMIPRKGAKWRTLRRKVCEMCWKSEKHWKNWQCSSHVRKSLRKELEELEQAGENFKKSPEKK